MKTHFVLTSKWQEEMLAFRIDTHTETQTLTYILCNVDGLYFYNIFLCRVNE